MSSDEIKKIFVCLLTFGIHGLLGSAPIADEQTEVSKEKISNNSVVSKNRNQSIAGGQNLPDYAFARGSRIIQRFENGKLVASYVEEYGNDDDDVCCIIC